MTPRRPLASAAALAALVLAVPLAAQVPPTPAEAERYIGLLGLANAGFHNDIIQWLVNGADPNVRDKRGRTPFLVAAHRGDIEAMRLLAKGGADPRAMDQDSYDAVTILAVANRPLGVATAIDIGGDPRAVTSPWQGTALIAAAHLGHVDVVRVLIGAGAPLDHVNRLGWTALIEAIVLGDGGRNHQRTVQLLLEAGADPNRPDRDGHTPLSLAEGRGYGAIAGLIRARGGR
jgi:hypothetical protein